LINTRRTQANIIIGLLGYYSWSLYRNILNKQANRVGMTTECRRPELIGVSLAYKTELFDTAYTCSKREHPAYRVAQSIAGLSL